MITLVNSSESTSYDQLVTVMVAPSDNSTDDVGDDEETTTGEAAESTEPAETDDESVSQSGGEAVNGSSTVSNFESSFDWRAAFAEQVLREKRRKEKEESAYVPPIVPVISIKEITNEGLIVFAFSEDMWVVPDDDLKHIKLSNVTDLSGVTRPLFDITVRRDEETPEDKIGFAWKLTKMTSRTLEIQVDFENPSYISVAADGPEFLEV